MIMLLLIPSQYQVTTVSAVCLCEFMYINIVTFFNVLYSLVLSLLTTSGNPSFHCIFCVWMVCVQLHCIVLCFVKNLVGFGYIEIKCIVIRIITHNVHRKKHRYIWRLVIFKVSEQCLLALLVAYGGISMWDSSYSGCFGELQNSRNG